MNQALLAPLRPISQATTDTDAASNQYSRLTLEVYPPNANGFEALQREWNTLLRRSRFNSVFLTYEWQTTWWRNLGKGDLWIIGFRLQQTNELVGIAPLYLSPPSPSTLSSGALSGRAARGQRQLNLVGCIDVSDYLDLIMAEGYEAPVYTALLQWLQSPNAPAWDVFDLCNLPEGSLTWQTLPTLVQAAGWQADVFQEDVAPQFALPLHYETYLQESVDKKQRHEIRRKQRRAEREAKSEFVIVDSQQSLEVEVDDFVALQRASRVDKADFMTPEMHHFFLAAARTMMAAGWLRLCFLILDGEKVATLYAFEYDRRFWLYNSGYDPQSHSQLSPGWVLLSYAIQYAIANGCRIFDFMQGDEEYKYRFGSHDYRVMRLMIRKTI